MSEKIENQLATLAIDNDQEIANFVDLIDSSLEPYRVNVSKLGLEAGRESQKAITKQKNKVAKFFKEKRDYFNSMSKKIIGVEKTINAPLLELEEDLKAQCEAEVLRQEKAYRVSMRPIRQASLEGLGLHIDEEALDSMTDTEFNEQVSIMLAQIAQAKKEEEEAKKRAEELEAAKKEAAQKAKKEAEDKAEKEKQEALKAAEEAKEKAANKAAADLKATQEKAEKEKQELIKTQRVALLPDDIDLLFRDPREKSQAIEDLLTIADQYFNQEILEIKKSIEAIKLEKVKADKERILGESRYAIIEGLELAGYCTASKQIVIEKAGVMADDVWEKSLDALKARKKEAEEKTEREKLEREAEEKARKEAEAVKGLKVETVDGDLIVTHHGKVILEEPTWTDVWLEPLIREVYKLGFDDGYSEGSSDTADAIQSDLSYRNGYLG